MSRSCLLRMSTCGFWRHMHAVSHACGATATVPGRQPKPAERLLRAPRRARRKTMTKTQLVAGHVGSEDSPSVCFLLLCEYVSGLCCCGLWPYTRRLAPVSVAIPIRSP